jgi:DNA repair exonuclease SbcCD ATPase subunit
MLRIPAERFAAAGSSIRSLGTLLSERTTVEDVTKAYTDLETRLRVKRDELARIRELLKTRAGSLKDILEAEREISRLTEELDLAEGERQFYDHQIRLSSLTVELQEPAPANFTRASAWSALGEVFRNSTTTIAESLAALIAVILVLLPWSAAAYGVYRWVRWLLRRRKARMQAVKEVTGQTGTAG